MPYWTVSSSISNTRFEFGGMLPTARGAVRELRRNDEPADAADLHADDPAVEPGDDAAGADRADGERERRRVPTDVSMSWPLLSAPR